MHTEKLLFRAIDSTVFHTLLLGAGGISKAIEFMAFLFVCGSFRFLSSSFQSFKCPEEKILSYVVIRKQWNL